MKKSPKNSPTLSIIILNYNAGSYLSDCLLSLDKSIVTDDIEVIVADNSSTDNSYKRSQQLKFKNKQIKYTYHSHSKNFGFAAGNNQALKLSNSNSQYVLFLNPDTTVKPDTIQGMIDTFKTNEYIDAATCYITLASTGKLQPESHRDFPTPINSFLHFSGITSRYYFMEYLDYSKIQKINCCVGAFLMLKRHVGNQIGWWNEKYFFYGEDLDFCYKLKQHKFNLYFIPNFKITHFQGISSGIKKTKSLASRQTKIQSALASTQAMKIFYEENLMINYPKFIHPLILLGIKLLELERVFKAKYL